MENIVELTRNLVDDLDAKVANQNTINDENYQTQSLLFDNNKSKLRVYELAQELNIDSKQLLTILESLGHNYNGHNDILDDNTVKTVKEFYNIIKDAALRSSKNENPSLIEDQVSNNDEEFDIQQIKDAHPYISVKLLHEKGYSIKEIAKILDRGQGEVSLLLNLSKKAKVIQS